MSLPLSFTAKRALAVPQDEFEAAPQKPVVVVTGGSGKLGRATVVELQQHGWQVINMDRAPPPKDAPKDAIYMYADLENMGEVMENLIEVDTVCFYLTIVPLHMLKGSEEIQSPRCRGAPRCPSRARDGGIIDPVQIKRHVVCIIPLVCTQLDCTLHRTYNILEASRKLGIKNLVLASSETLLGLPFAPWVPDYIPVDENSPRRPESAYSLSKLVGEVPLRSPSSPLSGLTVLPGHGGGVLPLGSDNESRFPSVLQCAGSRRLQGL